MFEDRKAARMERRVDALTRKNEELAQRCAALESENRVLKTEIDTLRENEAGVKKMYDEFQSAIQDARSAKGKYERAKDELKVLRKSYAVELRRLLAQIKH